MRILFGGQDVQTCAIGLIGLRHDPRYSRRHRPTELLLLSALQEGEATIGLSSRSQITTIGAIHCGTPQGTHVRRSLLCRKRLLTGKPHRIALDQTEPTDRVHWIWDPAWMNPRDPSW